MADVNDLPSALISYLDRLTQLDDWQVTDPIPEAVTEKCPVDVLVLYIYRHRRVSVWLFAQIEVFSTELLRQILTSCRFSGHLCALMTRLRELGQDRSIELARAIVAFAKTTQSQTFLIDSFRDPLARGKMASGWIAGCLLAGNSSISWKLVFPDLVLDGLAQCEELGLPVSEIVEQLTEQQYQQAIYATVQLDAFAAFQRILSHFVEGRCLLANDHALPNPEPSRYPRNLNELLLVGLACDSHSFLAELICFLAQDPDLPLPQISEEILGQVIDAVIHLEESIPDLAYSLFAIGGLRIRHDLLLVSILDDEECFTHARASGLEVDLTRVQKLFWETMTDPDRDDLWPGYQILWSHYSPYLRPAGILEAVDQLVDHQHDKSYGSRWQLASQIDPNACLWICQRANLAQTLIDLAWTGEEHLQAFLERFPSSGCPDRDPNLTAPDQECCHSLDLTQDGNRAIVYLATSRSFQKVEYQLSVIQMLVAASQKTILWTDSGEPSLQDKEVVPLGSYHLAGEMLLIVDSPVVLYSTKASKPDPTTISYCNLRVTGIRIGSKQPPAVFQVLQACQSCITLSQVIWSKSERTFAKQHEQDQFEIARLSMQLSQLLPE